MNNYLCRLKAEKSTKLIYKTTMKAGIHPESYRPVAFRDMSNGETFITRSTIATKETVEIDGVTYPLVKLEISSSSHPFYTGKQKLVDTAGRVDKFMNRYQKHLENKKK
jgi:large subunit ribosomal protein L31